MPLTQTLSRVSVAEIREADLSARMGLPSGAGWITAAGLCRDGRLLGGLLERIEQGYGKGGRALAGTMFLKDYLWRMLPVAVAAFLTERRLPDLGQENVTLRFDGSRRPAGLAFIEERFTVLNNDPDAASSGAVRFTGEGEMLTWLAERLAAAHLPELIWALRRCGVRRAERALWGLAADTLSESFMWVGRELGREHEAQVFAERMLDGSSPIPGATNFFVLEYDGGFMLTRVRNICCLYHRLGEGVCFTCPRTTNEERLRRLAPGVEER